MFSGFMLKLCWQLLQQSGVLSLLSPPGGRQEKRIFFSLLKPSIASNLNLYQQNTQEAHRDIQFYHVKVSAIR